MEERRRLSTTSRFSSPGTQKIRSTPSFSSAATRRSDPFISVLAAVQEPREVPHPAPANVSLFGRELQAALLGRMASRGAVFARSHFEDAVTFLIRGRT